MDKNFIYGGYQLVIVDETKGWSEILIHGYERLNTREMYWYLRGFSQDDLHTAKKYIKKIGRMKY